MRRGRSDRHKKLSTKSELENPSSVHVVSCSAPSFLRCIYGGPRNLTKLEYTVVQLLAASNEERERLTPIPLVIPEAIAYEYLVQ